MVGTTSPLRLGGYLSAVSMLGMAYAQVHDMQTTGMHHHDRGDIPTAGAEHPVHHTAGTRAQGPSPSGNSLFQVPATSRKLIADVGRITANEMKLIDYATQISHAVYNFDNEVGEFKARGWEYRVEGLKDAVLFKDITSEVSEKAPTLMGLPGKACLVAFRGTIFKKEDWVANFSAISATLEEKGGGMTCDVHEGFKESFLGRNYFQELDEFVDTCSTLVLTGHSQGGGIAYLASLYWRAKMPFVVNLAPAPAFYSPCEPIPQSHMLNFINVKTDSNFIESVLGKIEYDVVPFLSVVLRVIVEIGVASAAGSLVPGELGQAARDIEEAGKSPDDILNHYGPIILLSPMVTNDQPYSCKYVEAYEDINWIKAFFDFDLFDANGIFNANKVEDIIANAHYTRTTSGVGYLDKTEKLAKYGGDTPLTGFQSFEWCNHHNECEGDYCVRGLCSDGDWWEACADSSQCTDGACEWDLADLALRCQPLLEDGDICNENTDCEGGLCIRFVCTSGRNGQNCFYNRHCDSGRCDPNWTANLVCKGKLSNGSWGCNESSDCASGDCSYWGQCY